MDGVDQSMPRLRQDLFLLLQTGLLLAVTQVALRLLPFRVVRRLLIPQSRGRPGPSIPQIVRAVRVTGRCLPGCTCLPRALVAHFLLARAGEHPVLRIGLATDERGHLKGHAWVECRGRVVIGGARSSLEFTALLPFET